MPLRLVPGKGTRPILDRVKTALFDILRPRIDGMRVLDLFAGSGSVGIEALSQGAAHCTFIDHGKQAIATINQNLLATGFTVSSAVHQTSALDFLRSTPRSFDLIYIAPPQYKNLWKQALRAVAERPGLLATASEDCPNGGLAIVQIDPKEYENLELRNLCEIRQKLYGNTLLVFYERWLSDAGIHSEEQD
jgi:16S rRNA (guanine(966)-N(2))-methyltransferase RsmD